MFENLSQLMQGWLSTVLRTSLVFWLCVLFLWIINIIHWENFKKLFMGNNLEAGESIIIKHWQDIFAVLRNIPETGILLLIILAIIILSGIFVQFIQLKVLRLLEGYGWFAALYYWRTNYYIKQFKKDLARWEELSKKGSDKLTTLEYREYTDLDKKVIIIPTIPNTLTLDEKYILPTILGNILRGYEQRPREKYGLDTRICWSRLWLLIPKKTQQELMYARSSLDESVQLIIWGVLFFFWIIIGWEAIIIGFILIIVGYISALQAAENYGELIEATFDVHRHLLYEAVNKNIPEQNEKHYGEKLTQYLWRGE
jgi:hypothetical protein